MIIHMNLGNSGYDIVFERGLLNRAAQWLQLNRKVLIVTDDGVPSAYADALCAQCRSGVTVTVPSGERSKSLPEFERLLTVMLKNGFTRNDCVVAVGGGVVGDLAGFAAASYMRGVDFYNVPTTVLSQVDSSVGGKTALNLCGIKNVVGAFYQPKRVLIDPELTETLPPRQIANGLAESVKMALTSDAELFSIFENDDIKAKLDDIIYKSVMIKKRVVEADEKESGLRRVLNFGHTIGHAIESEESLRSLYHGECVSLGMLPMCSADTRTRLIKVLKKLNLPCRLDLDVNKTAEAVMHDKKCYDDKIITVFVNAPGDYCFKDMKKDGFIPLLEIIKMERQI